MMQRRHGWWREVAVSTAAAALLAATGCTSMSAAPTGPPTTALPATATFTATPGTATTGTALPGAATPATERPTTEPPGSATPGSATPATETPATETPAGEPPPTPTPDPAAPPGPSFTPAPDAEPVSGECPYLSKDQVQADTGQRMGPTRIRPAAPQPVCEFVRSDGTFLATVRVLQLGSAAAAVGAVDHYVPRDASNPESRPAGWVGGSLATDDGSTYGVSEGVDAVIATTNQKQSVYARLLAVHAIENLGL